MYTKYSSKHVIHCLRMSILWTVLNLIVLKLR